MMQKSIIKAVIFDLDGTLLNTLPGLVDAMNRVLKEQGLPVYTLDAYRQKVGNGVDRLVERAIPEDRYSQILHATVRHAFDKTYGANWTKGSDPYEGISKLLEALQARACSLAVNSNKPHNFAEEMTAHYFGPDCFIRVIGGGAGYPLKPDPAGALSLLRDLGCSAGETLYCGDSDVDMQTANNAGMIALGAGWGFRGRDELTSAGAHRVLDKPLDMLEFF